MRTSQSPASRLRRRRLSSPARRGCRRPVHEEEGPRDSERPPPFVMTDSGYEQDAVLARHFLPKLSNSPFRTPPRNACHSSEVKRSTAPWASRLLRTPISPSGRLATSTQLPLEKLNELLTQYEPESGFSAGFPREGCPTVYLTDCRF